MIARTPKWWVVPTVSTHQIGENPAASIGRDRNDVPYTSLGHSLHTKEMQCVSRDGRNTTGWCVSSSSHLEHGTKSIHHSLAVDVDGPLPLVFVAVLHHPGRQDARVHAEM